MSTKGSQAFHAARRARLGPGVFREAVERGFVDFRLGPRIGRAITAAIMYYDRSVTDEPGAGIGRPPAPQRPVPAMQCYVAYVTAFLVGASTWLLFQGPTGIEDPFLLGLAVTCAATIGIWIFSLANDNSSIYDPYWVVAPPILALALKAMGGDGLLGAWSARQVCVVVCLSLWAIRYHTMYSWTGWRSGLVEEDWRYESMRSAPLPYWPHLHPAVSVWCSYLHL